MDKPTKPTDLIPRSFGGVKNNFSASLQSSGYEDGVPAIYGGDNLNYQLDSTGKELDYCETICDYINAMPIGKTITVDSNNKLIYDNLVTDISGKADVDLQNVTTTITSIPPTSLINFDSKYTYQAVTNLLANITLPTKTTTTYYGDVDLTNYLPVDNYDYDVWLSLYIVSNAGIGNYASVTVGGETGTPYTIQTRNETNTNQFTQSTGHTIVGSGRKISVYYIATGGGTLTNLHMFSYRRIGTNA